MVGAGCSKILQTEYLPCLLVNDRCKNKTNTLQVVIDASLEIGFPLNKSGTCVAIEGPRFSSRAEVG